MTIIHSPHGNEITQDCKPLPNEVVIDSRSSLGYAAELDQFLKDNNITTLLYAGYAANWYILFSPTGIVKMKLLGYNTILIRDCTIAIETPRSLDGEWALRVTVNTVEH